MPKEISVELYTKYGGESTMRANQDFLFKGMAGSLDEGWSKLVLVAMASNNQGHLYRLLKPTEEDRKKFLDKRKKQDEAEKRRKNKMTNKNFAENKQGEQM